MILCAGMASTALVVGIMDDDEALAYEVAESVRVSGNLAVQLSPDAFMARDLSAGEDVLILDIAMPGIDGLDVLKKAAAAERPPAIILISGHGEAVLRGAAAAAERSGLRLAGSLAKPFDAETLTGLLNTLGREASTPASAAVSGHAIRAAVARAIEDCSLAVSFQPVVRTTDFGFAGAEALLQGTLPGLPELPPATIVHAVSEDADLLSALTYMVVRRAAEACSHWRSAGHGGTVAVNLPAGVLRDAEASETLRLIVTSAGLCPTSMALELIEDDVYDSEAATLASLVRLRLAGFGLLLDDVGQRESGLLQLSALPVTGIKIDIELLRAARRWDKSRRIYAALADLGSHLGLSVTAEGVETEVDARFVRALGVPLLQGFHVSRKLPLQDLLAKIPALGAVARAKCR